MLIAESDLWRSRSPDAEYQGDKAKIDFDGNVLFRDLRSKTALRLPREWIDLHDSELKGDWSWLVMVSPLRRWRCATILAVEALPFFRDAGHAG